MIVLIGLVVLWLGLGILGSAYGYNYLQLNDNAIAERSESGDFKFCVKMAFWGPLNLMAILMSDFKSFGPRFRRYKYVAGVRQP